MVLYTSVVLVKERKCVRLRRFVGSLIKATIACYTWVVRLNVFATIGLLFASLSSNSVSTNEDEHSHHHPFSPERFISSFEKMLYLLVVVPLIAFLPAPLAYDIACWRGDWSYRHDTFVRERIMQSLEGVLREQLSQEERQAVTRDFFRRRSCEAIDVMRLAGKGRALIRLVEIRGLEHIEAALKAGKGAILCSAHYGLFNGGCSLIGAVGYPITAVGDWKSKADPHMSLFERLFWRYGFEKRVARHRRRPSIESRIEGSGIAIRIAEILRSNELVALPIDAPPSMDDRSRAVSVDFLGRQVLLLPGSVQIAQLTGSKVLVLVPHRLGDWRHQVLEILPVSLDGDTTASFRRCVALIEVPIRRYPAFWNGWEDAQELVDLGLLPAS